MEKRLFIAIFLSLIVVFGFQALFGPRNTPSKETQTVEINAFKVEGQLPPAPHSPIVPPEPEKKPALFTEKTLDLENDLYLVNVSNKGGNIDSIHLKEYNYLSPVKAVLNFDLVENEEFKMERISKEKARFVHKSANWQFLKEVTLNENYTISVKVKIKNISSSAVSFAGKRSDFIVDTSRLDSHNVQSDFMLYEYSIKTDKRIVRKDNARAFTDKWNKEELANVEWRAFRDKYFVTLIQSQVPDTSYLIKSISDKELYIGSTLSPLIIEAGAEVSYDYKIFAGPQQLHLSESG